MGALKGTHMHHPSGGALMGHPKGAPYVHPTGAHLYNACARVREAPSGQFRPFYSPFRPKLAGDFLLGSTS